MDQSVIINALYELGFQIEDVGTDEYMFHYEDLGYLYNPEEDDDAYFHLNAPCIYSVDDEESRPVILDIINEVNCRIKYTKTLLVGDSVWISYEARMFEGMDAEEFVRFAIILVRATADLFYCKVNGGDEPAVQEMDESDNDNNFESDNDKNL